MRDRLGVGLGALAGLLALVVLAWPYTQQPTAAIALYYTAGPGNAFAVGLLLAAVLGALAAVRAGVLSATLGYGVALGLGLVALLAAALWASTVREDVFLARGWAMPARRFVLLALVAALVGGLGYHTVANGYVPARS